MAGTGPHCCYGNQYCGAGTAEVWGVLARRGDQGVWSIQSHPHRPAGVCRLHHQATFYHGEFDDHVQYIQQFTNHFYSHGQHYMLQLLFNSILVPKIITGGVFRRRVVCDKLETFDSFECSSHHRGTRIKHHQYLWPHTGVIIPCIYWPMQHQCSFDWDSYS